MGHLGGGNSSLAPLIGQACLYAQACAMYGPQWHAAVGIPIQAGSGSVSPGVSDLYGGAYFGGAGFFGELQITGNSSGGGATRGLPGIGTGAGAVVLDCKQAVFACVGSGSK